MSQSKAFSHAQRIVLWGGRPGYLLLILISQSASRTLTDILALILLTAALLGDGRQLFEGKEVGQKEIHCDGMHLTNKRLFSVCQV